MFTLRAGTSSPSTTACVKDGIRIVDVRHEQTATFAAEGDAKLTRRPGVAVLTAGPGRHQRHERDDDRALQRLAAGRARRPRPAGALGRGLAAGVRPRAGGGLDHEGGAHGDRAGRDRRRSCTRRSRSPSHRTAGRCSSTSRSTSCSRATRRRARRGAAHRRRARPRRRAPRPRRSSRRAERPVLVAGGDVMGRRRVGRAATVRRVAAGAHVRQRPGPRVPARRSRARVRTRPADAALKQADVVVVVGTPLDFRLSFGSFGAAPGRARRRPPRQPRRSRRDRGVARRRPVDDPRRHGRAQRPARGPRATGSRGCATEETAPLRPSEPTARRPTPTRSSRRASTASCARALTATRS